MWATYRRKYTVFFVLVVFVCVFVFGSKSKATSKMRLNGFEDTDSFQKLCNSINRYGFK